jgi:uroporphyrinogen decarboxylase
MARESMTPRERWRAVLARRKPDRVPMDYWGTKEATEKVMRHLGVCSRWEMYERLHIDKVVSVAPRYVGPKLPRTVDMYGRRFKWVNYGAGTYKECVAYPLAGYQTVEEVAANYGWPTADWFDYSGLRYQVRGRKKEYPIQGGGSEPFLIYADLRGREQAYMDLMTNPEMVHYCLGKLFDFCYENTRRIYEQLPGQIDLSYVAEDFGGQESLLFSPAAIREFFLPGMKRMIDLAHEAGVYVFFHSDGAIRRIIPDMIAAGIDVLNPLQWRTPGMERAGIKRDFGGQVVLHGGVDNQYTLPFGTVAEVEAEVIENLCILGANGGYIVAPCHNIQAVSPAENVVALYRAGYAHGWN